ncbi:hypothetical protein RFI_30517 [Reticulomyxa filosa]|uniref:Uncharacterized protein n=1 Tax=Reticulomyxa filosa TaxID=46433 RepID=X6LYA8_RETFI|nr:hypothetical protein RFI_30517 [Reticulomyxa filosa]|eukprot:ETO06873.1 hypothetical protein RFI_30517 [Reticulomyxa filosa]
MCTIFLYTFFSLKNFKLLTYCAQIQNRPKKMAIKLAKRLFCVTFERIFLSCTVLLDNMKFREMKFLWIENCFMVHWLVSNYHSKTYSACEELYRKGKICSIEMNNYLINDYKELLEESNRNYILILYSINLKCFHLRNEQKYHLALSQICLKWCIQHLILSLVKSSCGANERKYSGLCTSNTIIELSNEDMKKLNEMMKRKDNKTYIFLFEMEEFFSIFALSGKSLLNVKKNLNKKITNIHKKQISIDQLTF